MREDDLLAWIYSQATLLDSSKVPVGPGDDMAVLASPRDNLLIACDQVLDGIHIDLAKVGPQAAGRKALARNLSDIAAMAALPVACVVSVALPRGFSQEDAQALHRGITTLGQEFSCPLVGGDTASWGQTDGRLAISVTVLACPAGATGGIEPILRSGARAGNAICVTGELGGAWQGGRDLTFKPLVQEAIILALRYRPRAMIDISDGLAKDLGRLCKASGVGAEIWSDAIPIHPDAGRENVSPLEAALGDGEDYQLLFTLPPGQAKRLCDDSARGAGLRNNTHPLRITQIGKCTKDPAITLVHPDGCGVPMPEAGWQHEG